MALEIKTETSLDAAMQSDNISTIIKNESHCGDPQQEQFVYPVKTELQECEQIVTPEEVLYFTQAVKEERYPINEDSEVKEEMDFEEHEPLNTSGRRYLQNVNDEDEIVLQTVDLKTEEPEPSEVKPDVSGPSTVNRSCNAGSSTQTRIRCGTVCSYNMKLKAIMGDEQQQLRCAPLIDSQKRILVEFLAEHPELQSGNFSQSFTKKRGRELWEQVAGILSSIPNGARKSWLQWRRTWQDQKKLTKAKVTRMRQRSRITGGGGPSEEGLNEYEEEVASLINPFTIAGDQSIRESNPQRAMEQQFVATVTNTAEVSVIIEEYTVEVPMESIKENVPASLQVPAKVDKSVAGPSTERTTPFHVRRATKFKGKSLSDELVQSCKQRTQTMSEFQKAKLAHLKRERLRRKRHEKQKLELLRETKEIKLQKLVLLRESNEIRSSQLRQLQEINQNLQNIL